MRAAHGYQYKRWEKEMGDVVPPALQCSTAHTPPCAIMEAVNWDVCAGHPLHSGCGESCGLWDRSVHLLCCPNPSVTTRGNLLCQGWVGCGELPRGCACHCCPGRKIMEGFRLEGTSKGPGSKVGLTPVASRLLQPKPS